MRTFVPWDSTPIRYRKMKVVATPARRQAFADAKAKARNPIWATNRWTERTYANHFAMRERQQKARIR